jgi:hypothetical protein
LITLKYHRYMNHSVAELFVILALNPEKGRISLDSIHFRYSLTGALIMEYHEMGDFTIQNKRIVPSFRLNGDMIHDLIAGKIMNSGRHRRISVWINRLTGKYRIIFRTIAGSLENKDVIRIEQKWFLNIIPYKRYRFTDFSIRKNLIENLRGILLYGKQADKKEIMLLSLVEASNAYRMLSRERGERRLLKKKNSELFEGDAFSSEITRAIKEVQAATIASISAASAAAHAAN